MLRYLRNKWASIKANNTKRQEISPESFSLLTTEILELVHLVEKIHPGDQALGAKLARLHGEIKQLQSLLGKRTLGRLSPERRMELKKHLTISRQQLLNAMGAVNPPTDRIQ